jgi:hypothetical protein
MMDLVKRKLGSFPRIEVPRFEQKKERIDTAPVQGLSRKDCINCINQSINLLTSELGQNGGHLTIYCMPHLFVRSNLTTGRHNWRLKRRMGPEDEYGHKRARRSSFLAVC